MWNSELRFFQPENNNTVEAISCLENLHIGHPTSCLFGWDMGCVLSANSDLCNASITQVLHKILCLLDWFITAPEWITLADSLLSKDNTKPLPEPMSRIPWGMLRSKCVNSSPPGQNGHHFGRWHFQMHFLEWKWYNSISNFTEICCQESNWQKASIGSGNGLVPNRRQAITWTNDGPVHWRIYAALGGDELKIHTFIFCFALIANLQLHIIVL